MTSEARTTTGGGAGKTILLVDDDIDFVEALSSFLEASGYTVIRAHSGEEGLKLARMQEPDLVIMDVMMTERTEGFFAVQQIRREPRIGRVPIFVCSSIYSDPSVFEITPDAGWLSHDEFIRKPANLADLLARIRQRIGPGNKEEAR